MAYSVTPISGVDLTSAVPTNLAQDGSTLIPTMGPLGNEVFGSDGFRYVFAQAGAAIAASLTTCSVNASTFIATPSAGTYSGPLVAMASGDYGWFGKASV